jgi:hypothetical protein
MTNPTSNFGWQMPTPTDLVTDLPADFEVFGQAVDTSMADLKGGTTGQILSKATNTDMDFTWITNDVGDITNIAVTSPITGGGSSGSVTIGVSAATTSAAGVVQLSDSTSTTSSVLASTPTATKSAYDLADTANTTANAAIAKSTVTTAGDIIYRNATVPTRLGIGTAGQVLAVNSGATAPEWIAAPSGGGMTLLSTTSLSGATTTISSISGSYNQLFVEVLDYYVSSPYPFVIRFNSDATANAYQGVYDYYPADAAAGQRAPFVAKDTIYYLNYGSVGTSDTNNYASMTFQNYSLSTVRKTLTSTAMYTNSGGNATVERAVGGWLNAAAITSITFITAGGTFSQGSVKIWGIK